MDKNSLISFRRSIRLLGQETSVDSTLTHFCALLIPAT